MSNKIRIAVDAMSGDLGPRVAICAAQNFIASEPNAELVLFGDESQLRRFYKVSRDPFHQIHIVHCTERVTMDDNPLHAVRHKKHSSMYQSLQALADDHVDACVSAGNTGALLVMGKHLIGTINNIERPAICKSMPVRRGQTLMLDLGANINCSAQQLHQFALMASFLVDSPEALEDMPASVGLLNIGTELGKGTDVLQETYQLLSNDSRFRFVGFVEANAIFSGECDVIVCDGFHGNIALKASEGTARFITDKIQSTLKSGWFGRLGLLLAWPFLKKLRRSLDPSEYNGASFLGLKKTLVKSHGDANEKAFLQAIKVAHEQALSNIPQRINLSLG